MSQKTNRRLYIAQADAYRRQWLQQRGCGDSRLTCKQNAELKNWFEFWDRDSEGNRSLTAFTSGVGNVDPRSIARALYALGVLSDEQREVLLDHENERSSQEFDALIEAATDGDEFYRFNYAEFRTLMTYPKKGIAKKILNGQSPQSDRMILCSDGE